MSIEDRDAEREEIMLQKIKKFLEELAKLVWDKESEEEHYEGHRILKYSSFKDFRDKVFNGKCPFLSLENEERPFSCGVVFTKSLIDNKFIDKLVTICKTHKIEYVITAHADKTREMISDGTYQSIINISFGPDSYAVGDDGWWYWDYGTWR